MCGIVTVRRYDNRAANKQTWKRYKAQKNRGSEGFGYVAIGNDNKIAAFMRRQFEHGIETELNAAHESTIMFHHRYPTSVLNIAETAHPIRVSHHSFDYDWYLVHNGWINNDEELRDKHIAAGFKYTTEVETKYRHVGGITYEGGLAFNDSEALAIEFARFMEGQSVRVACEGPIAFTALQVDKRTGKTLAIYYGTNGGNPLTIQKQEGVSLVIASEGGKPISANVLYRLDLITEETTEHTSPLIAMPERKPVGTYADTARAFDHYGKTRASDYGDSHDASELEMELSMVDDQIIGVKAEILDYVASGDHVAEDGARTELRRLLDDREDIEAELHAATIVNPAWNID